MVVLYMQLTSLFTVLIELEWSRIMETRTGFLVLRANKVNKLSECQPQVIPTAWSSVMNKNCVGI